MTLPECYVKNQGKAVLVPGGGSGNNGQCVQWADTVIHDVYGLPYTYTPAAKDFWYDADKLGLTAHLDKIPAGQPILAGDVIMFDPLSKNDPQGHIDVASRNGSPADFWAYDSNWDAANHHDTNGYPVVYEAHHIGPLNNKVIGYLRIKGATDMATKEQLQVLYAMCFPNEALNNDWVNANIGKDMSDVLTRLKDDPSRQALVTRLVKDSAAFEAGGTQGTELKKGTYYVQ